MGQKFFPIKTKTACQLKWNWSTLVLQHASTASCHRTGESQLTPDNFQDFHNTPKKIAEREAMLRGEWPDGSCAYCREIEDNGGFSDRMLHLTIPDMVPPELGLGSVATKVSPTILEVYFNNTCNMACLYCAPFLSSQINQENKKFGHFDRNGVVLRHQDVDKDYQVLLDQFWQWMTLNSSKLKRFNLLGGEPFYQTEFYNILDYFEQTTHPDLEFNITTNLMIDIQKLDVTIARLRNLVDSQKLRRVDMTCSIDCWGAEQEYVRYGISLEQWQTNFERLLSEKWLTINLNQTISVLTIKTMPALLEKLHQWRLKHAIGHYFSAIATKPTYMYVNILGAGVFDQDFENIIALMPLDTQQDVTAVSYMKSIGEMANRGQPNLSEMKKLKTYLIEKDRRRQTDYRHTFPWLETEFDKCGIVA